MQQNINMNDPIRNSCKCVSEHSPNKVAVVNFNDSNLLKWPLY
jgi:hypothetical protein